jgi:prepilin-type N-terminal cleavage/methylation domain-containing protein
MSRRATFFDGRSNARRGYTAIEVLMAMTVMAIGAAGVISMQKTSIVSNLDARKTDVANAIARTWVERIKRDLTQWTQPGPTNEGAPSNLAVAAVAQAGFANAGAWFLPNQYLTGSASHPPISPGFDILGRDLPATALAPSAGPPIQPGALFCVNVRLTRLAGDLFRIDVRVLWPRGISNDSNHALPSGGVCDSGVATSVAPDPQIFHSLYVTTAVRGNPL